MDRISREGTYAGIKKKQESKALTDCRNTMIAKSGQWRWIPSECGRAYPDGEESASIQAVRDKDMLSTHKLYSYPFLQESD